MTRSGRPVTVRELAACTGVRRDSVGRALRMLERAGRAWRERGDTRRGIADRWSAASTAASMVDVASAGEVLDAGSRRSSGVRAKMKAASVLQTNADGGLVRSCKTGSTAVEPPRRLARGELQALILQILREDASESLGVVALSRRAGGRSQGAVADACERLVKQGQAVMTYNNARHYAAVEQP